MGITAASIVPDLSARNTSSKRCTGTTAARSPSSWRTASWLKAPSSPWKPTFTFFGTSGASSLPACGGVGRKTEEVEHAVDAVIDEIEDGGGFDIEAGDGGRDNGAHFGERGHGAQVAEVKRAFADHEHEFAALFEMNVGGAQEQIGREAHGDGGHAVDGAWRDDHAICEERSAGERGTDVVEWIGFGGERLEFLGGAPELEMGGALGGAGHDEMGLDAAAIAEFFEQSPAVNGPAGAGDADHNSQKISPRDCVVRKTEQNWCARYRFLLGFCLTDMRVSVRF